MGSFNSSKIIFIILTLIILLINNSILALEKGTKKEELIVAENELRIKSLNLVEFIIRKEIKNIVALLPEEGQIQFGIGDQYKNKKEIVDGLEKEQYEYAYLFDTNKSKKYFSKFICIRDQLLELKKKNLRIGKVYFNEVDPNIAHVYFTWDGKGSADSQFDFCCFVFQLYKGKWELASLVFNL